MSGRIEARLKELGIELPQPAAPVAAAHSRYRSFTFTGMSVHTPWGYCQVALPGDSD